MTPPGFKVGRIVEDPHGRHVEVLRHGEDASGPYVEVRLAGSYCAAVRYSVSALRSRACPICGGSCLAPTGRGGSHCLTCDHIFNHNGPGDKTS